MERDAFLKMMDGIDAAAKADPHRIVAQPFGIAGQAPSLPIEREEREQRLYEIEGELREQGERDIGDNLGVFHIPDVYWLTSEVRALLAALRSSEAALSEAVHPHAALLGFMGWLTSRDPVVGPFSARHGASEAAELVAEFAASQGWADLPDQWTHMLKPYPRAAARSLPETKAE